MFDFSTGSKISLMTVYCHGDCIFPSLSIFIIVALFAKNKCGYNSYPWGGGFCLFIVNKKYSMLVSSIENNLKGENIKAENE